ncbi:adaptor protein MecA [Ligilactobacillus ceti]|nr:adaptor protein MecA [Ligilactobacillus ceti]
MEMEKINANTIRVLIENEDMIERGLTVLDLLGNHKDIEKFFYEILEEVDTDHEFRDTEAVTFQVMPDRNGLELFITKVDPENLSAETKELLEKKKAELTEGLGIAEVTQSEQGLNNAAQLYSDQGNTNQVDNEAWDEDDHYLDNLANVNEVEKHYVFRLATFNDFVDLAKVVPSNDVMANLYYYQDAYYLDIVVFDDQNKYAKDRLAVTLAGEYAVKITQSPTVLAEHGKLIMESAAFELARHYFK